MAFDALLPSEEKVGVKEEPESTQKVLNVGREPPKVLYRIRAWLKIALPLDPWVYSPFAFAQSPQIWHVIEAVFQQSSAEPLAVVATTLVKLEMVVQLRWGRDRTVQSASCACSLLVDNMSF